MLRSLRLQPQGSLRLRGVTSCPRAHFREIIRTAVFVAVVTGCTLGLVSVWMVFGGCVLPMHAKARHVLYCVLQHVRRTAFTVPFETARWARVGC